MRVLGIDEAGRGCVFGPMVVASFFVEDVSEEVLRAAGADDSKAISAKKRMLVRGQLEKLGRADVQRIEPSQIDEGNLNQLEERVIVELVDRWKPDVVYVDALGHPSTIPSLVERMRRGRAQRWIMEPKADSTYAVVGAASIFAKTTRDSLLEGLKAEFGDLGSGYPSDPRTREWILAWARSAKPWPSFVRTRWGTIRALAQTAVL